MPQGGAPISTVARTHKFWTQVRWLALPACLVLLSVILVLWARYLYPRSSVDTFKRQFSEDLVFLAVVSVGGALLDIVARSLATIRTDMDKLRDLLTRMRDAHVRIAHAKRLLEAARSKRIYVAQMRELMLIIPELEDIERDVTASKRLFAGRDKEQICCGISQIVNYLERLCDEYVRWARSRAPRPPWRSQREISDFIKGKAFPDEYYGALSRSKGIIRSYVYGYDDT
jgi:hypothetical protein